MRLTILAAALLSSVALSGCQPVTAPLSGADPADPGAPVAGVAARSTIAPYTPLRPVAPTNWRNQNDRAAPDAGSTR